MVQVLDQYRKAYEKITSKHCFEMPDEVECLTVPTWEYVCWLEKLLSKTRVLVEETSSVSTVTSTKGDR